MSRVDQEIELAAFIREIDGNNDMGACKLAERILEWQAARQQAGSSDRDVLVYLMNRFDSEEWNCPQCGHSEPTSDMDSAIHLREYLAAAPQAEQAVEPVTPAPDVSGQVQQQSLLEGALRSLNAGEVQDVRQRLEAAIDAHQQEGK